MNCAPINLTKEEVRNARKNQSVISGPSINQTAEETIEKLRALKNAVKKIEEVYYVAGEKIKKRVSEVAKRKKKLRAESITPDNEIQRQGGTHIHDIMANLVDFHINGVGNLKEIQDKALVNGPVKLNGKHFDSLNKLALKIKKDVEEQQKKIDPKGKATVLTEAFMADFIKDIGGTEDIVVVFSDNTGWLYDYKTSGRNDPINSQGQVQHNPLPYRDLDAYNLSQAEYKRIMEEKIGIKYIRQNRLIPIAVNYKKKPVNERTKTDSLIPEVNYLATVIDDMETLRSIPAGGEKSQWEGINKIIEKQYGLIKKLNSQLKNRNLTKDQKEHLIERISRIEKSINSTLVDANIYDLIETMNGLAIEVSTRLDEPEMLESGEKNPSYLTYSEVGNLLAEMTVYSDIIKETDSYFKDIKEENPDKYKMLIEKLDTLRGPFERVQVRLEEESQLRASQYVSKDYWKDDKGHLVPMEELNFGQLKFIKISQINHPIFQAAWKVIEDAQYEIKQRVTSLDEEVYAKEQAVFKWAKENNMSRTEAWNILINSETGNMYSKLRKGFAGNIRSLIKEGGSNAAKIAKENYDFRDKDKWSKEYKERLESYKNIRKAAYSNFEPTLNEDGSIKVSAAKKKELYEKDIERWITNNDLEHSPEAWGNDVNIRRYLTLKESIVEANLSDEYKRIRSIKPLHEFYEMWNKRMEEFSNILGIADYSTLPPNFIPNIRKEMIEYLNEGGINITALYKEFMESMNVREEDVYLSSQDADGFERQVPILFINKFFTADGKIDNVRKSYDLGTSMMVFGKMAYNYEYMTRVEPIINGLKHELATPTAEQGGTQVTNRLGRKIKGFVEPYITRKGEGTDTYKLFEDLMDYYLYGIKFKNKTFVPGVDMIHRLTKLKNANSVLKLSFALTPAAGAWVAGNTALYFIGKKGIQYTEEQLRNTNKLIITKAKLVKGLKTFFDASNDDYFERELQKHKASTKNKWLTSRTGFAPLREVDSSITTDVLTSMAQNWGVKEDGTIIRLNRPGVDKSKYKSIIDLLEFDKEGKPTVKGLSKEGFKQFRAAVKSTLGEAIGNMNPDDIGAVDTDFYMNQMMAFKGWMPELVQEYMGDLRWDDTVQAMRWGRFKAYLNDYRKDLNFTPDQLEEGRLFYAYMSKVVAPNVGKLVLDLATFGLVPSIKKSRVNENRARLMFAMWQSKQPINLRDKVTYEDFLEIKQGQIKAMIVQLRFLIGIMGLAMFLAGAGDDGKPRYASNFVTRTFHKIFTKAGSELTFMWNPTEFLRLVQNPWPLSSLFVQGIKTVTNGFDETRDLTFGENAPQDKTPAGYFMMQWMIGGPQLGRFFEVFDTFQKSQYEVFSINTR